jgi:hypothetical protein
MSETTPHATEVAGVDDPAPNGSGRGGPPPRTHRLGRGPPTPATVSVDHEDRMFVEHTAR